jgi:hypothetical protein
LVTVRPFEQRSEAHRITSASRDTDASTTTQRWMMSRRVGQPSYNHLVVG